MTTDAGAQADAEDMTSQLTAHDAATPLTHDTALRATALLGLVGGAAWVIDTVTIAVLNRAFDPLDSVLFFLGAACLVLTLVALAVHVSAGRTGAARLRVALAAFFATTAVLATISLTADIMGRRVFSPANVGLHDEWSCFSIGLCLLAISWWAASQSRRRA